MKLIILELLTMCYPVILAAVLHMVIVKVDLLKGLKYPIDHFKTFKGKRIFGDNKTYRGLIVMALLSIAFTYLHSILSQNSKYNILTYDKYSFWFYGFLFGVGYILGELPNSFLKRQIGIEPGKAKGLVVHIVDQLDSVICILLLLIPFSNFTWEHFFIGLLFFGVIHLIINYILYLSGIRKTSI